MLRVREQKTAEYLTNQLPQVNIREVTTVSGASDSSASENDIDFTSSAEDRITTQRAPMLEPSDIIQLPKGQAFALLEGGHLWKIRIPLAKKDKKDDMPANIKRLVEDMEKDYRTGEQWWVGNSAPEFDLNAIEAGETIVKEREFSIGTETEKAPVEVQHG